MNEEDRLRQEDLDAAHAVVRRMYKRSMVGAVLGGLLFAAGFASVFYFTRLSHDIDAAIFVGLVGGVVVGVPLAWRWWRHYKSIFQQLDDLRRRVVAGEAVYGSQVVFRRTSN